MIIALDYDATYTADPQLWDRFIVDCIHHGHHVTIVTKREPEHTVSVGIQIPVIYTSRTKKIDKMPEGTIFIDDGPHGVIYDDQEMRQKGLI